MSLALNETQPKSATCSEVTAILKMHVQNLGYPLSLQIWGPTQKNHLLGPTWQLNGNFNGLYRRNKTWYRPRQSGNCVDNYRGSPTSSQNFMNFGHKRLQTGPLFLTTLCKFCFLRHCQASQADIRKRNSTKLCKRRTANRANSLLCNSCGRPTRKNGGQKVLHLFGFSTTLKLNGEYLLNETWHRQSNKGAVKYEGSPTFSKKIMNFGLQTA